MLAKYLLLIYIVSIPLEGLLVTWGMAAHYFTGSTLVIAGLFLARALYLKRFNLIPPAKWFVFFVIYILFNVLIRGLMRDSEAILHLGYILYLSSLFVIALNYKFSKRYIELLFFGYAISSMISGLLAYRYFRGASFAFFAGRMTYSETYNPTWLGAYLAFSIIPVFYLLTHGKKNLWLYLVAVINLVMLAMTQSRNAMIALVLSLLSVLLFQPVQRVISSRYVWRSKRDKLRIFMFVFVVFLATVLVLYMISREYVFSRFYGLLSGDLTIMTSGRNRIWLDYFDMITHPFLGHGFGTATMDYISTYYLDRPPHSSIVLILYELGIVGLVLFLHFYYRLIQSSLRHAYAPILIMCITFGLYLSIGNDTIFYRYFWLTLYYYAILHNASDDHLSRGGANSTKGTTVYRNLN